MPGMVKQGARRRVALAGAKSFLGRRLLGLLEGDDGIARVVALDGAGPVDFKTRAYQIDLGALSASQRISEILGAERIDTLVHLAFSPAPRARPDAELERTKRILAGARETPPDALIVWSHTWLYGASADNPALAVEDQPLRAPRDEPFLSNKIAAESEVARYAAEHPETTVMVLRTAPIVGPSSESIVTSYLAQRMLVTLVGFDPLWQLLHEADAAAAFKLAVDRPTAGSFNIAGAGALPLSRVVRLSAKPHLSLFHPVARAALARLWAHERSAWPPALLPYLRYSCVADRQRAVDMLGFEAACSSEEALTT